MSHATQILVLIVLWVVIAIACHVFIRHYFLASFLASVASVLVMLYSGYMELGHLDPYWHVSSISGFFIAGIIALIAGLPFRIIRTVKNEDD